MKQTSVEWFQVQIDNKDMGEIPMWIYDFIQEAKLMEKEQIVDAFVECWKENMPEGYECKQLAEYYYNETYHSVESNEMIDHIGDANKMVCEHSYSRSMNQPYPRKCIKCKEAEGGQE